MAKGKAGRTRQNFIKHFFSVLGPGLITGMIFQKKLALYSSYVVGGTVPRGSIPIASYWDTNDPYQYLRVDRRAESDYAIFGGEDHKTGQARNTELVSEKSRRLFSSWCRKRRSIIADPVRSLSLTMACLTSAPMKLTNLLRPAFVEMVSRLVR